MLYINENGKELHITDFEKMDNRKEYDRMFNIMRGGLDSCETIIKHIDMTTPVFGEWNLIKDRKDEFVGLGVYWKEKIDYEEETS